MFFIKFSGTAQKLVDEQALNDSLRLEDMLVDEGLPLDISCE
jgi:hypothetical protein